MSFQLFSKRNISKSKIIHFFLIYFKKGFIIILIIITLFLNFKFNLKIFISLLISLIIDILIFTLIVLKILEIIKKGGFIENWHELYGQKILNLPYFTNDIIINSFKKGGINFNEEIGNINNGNDYQKNELNYYDIYIPYSSLKRKNKYNGIILFIHGGGWEKGIKDDMGFFCSRYAKYGYITATMNYTLLIKKYKEYNIFRILDEITACINNIKAHLNKEGFDENKLEIALGGASAGAHLSLLYGYSIKNSPIPVKFVINIVGPVSLEPDFWYILDKDKEPLDNIEPIDIENAIKEKRIVKEFEKDETIIIKFMNSFIGDKYNDKDIKEILINKKINKDNEKYKEILRIINFAFPLKYINSNTPPTLCEYGGIDDIAGVAHYSFLKKISEKYGNKLELVYMREGDHSLMNYDTLEGINTMREMNYQILHFAKTYFTLDD